MTIRLLQVAVFTAALMCFVAQVSAQDAPVPSKAPPRVPFTAFRTKPILDLKSQPAKPDDGSIVVQDEPEKKKKTPAKTITLRETDAPAPLVKIRPIMKPVLDDTAPARPRGVEDDIIFSPRLDAPLVAASQPVRSVRNGIPIPQRKPAMMVTRDSGSFSIIDRILAEPAEPAKPADIGPVPQVPRPPQDTAQQEPPPSAEPASPEPPLPPETDTGMRVPPSKPVIEALGSGSVRIRDNNNRFNAHSSRMGGGNSARVAARSLHSLGLPEDMKDLSIGPLRQGKGVSPVLMPGQKVTMAAPDARKTDSRGIPNEVVVFFQEASSELEVGQMDVVNSDAIKVMKSRSDLSLEIVGFAEPQKGGKEETKKMALSRALMIHRYLTRAGIPAERLTVEGKGDDTSIEPRDRVEMYFDR